MSKVNRELFDPCTSAGFPGGSVVKNLSAIQEIWVQFLGREDPLEEGMATHSSILAWRIPWTEEPGRLQSMGLQRVGWDWVTKHTLMLHICLPWRLMTKDRSSTVSLWVWAQSCREGARFGSLPTWSVPRKSLTFSLLGALWSAWTFTSGKRKKKPCSFKILSKKGFSDAQISPGWKPQHLIDYLHAFSFPLLFKSKRFSHKPQRTGLLRPFRDVCFHLKVHWFQLWSSVLRQHEVTWSKSLLFSEPHFREGRLNDIFFSYRKYQQSSWENV